MSSDVPTGFGGAYGGVGRIGDRLELFGESVDPPCLGIDAGPHGVTDAEGLNSRRRRVGDQRADEQDGLHGTTTVLTEWSPDFDIVRFYTSYSTTILLVDSSAPLC